MQNSNLIQHVLSKKENRYKNYSRNANVARNKDIVHDKKITRNVVFGMYLVLSLWISVLANQIKFPQLNFSVFSFDVPVDWMVQAAVLFYFLHMIEVKLKARQNILRAVISHMKSRR